MYYNYYEAMKEVVKQFLEDEFLNQYSDVDSLEELSDRLNDDLFIHDSITGNASGSYTFNSHEAKEYVLDNMDLCKKDGWQMLIDYEKSELDMLLLFSETLKSI